MKHLLLLIFILGFEISTNAQLTIESIVKAENNFEKACMEKGIKQGFLENLDSSAVVFTEKGIVNAFQFWNSLSNFEGIYSWAPSYAEVSKSGDWGYTTGSVEYREKSLQDTPTFYSQYTTIWHKNKDGNWKYLVDIGNRHPSKKIDRTTVEVKTPKFQTQIKEDFLADLEKGFSETLINSGIEGVRDFYSEKYILNLNGEFPITNLNEAMVKLSPHLKYLSFAPYGYKIAPAGDMAVVYGYITHQGKTNHYVRVWRNEQNGWKIALEVIKF
jgi:ketosteroid isomerase-like protein